MSSRDRRVDGEQRLRSARPERTKRSAPLGPSIALPTSRRSADGLTPVSRAIDSSEWPLTTSSNIVRRRSAVASRRARVPSRWHWRFESGSGASVVRLLRTCFLMSLKNTIAEIRIFRKSLTPSKWRRCRICRRSRQKRDGVPGRRATAAVFRADPDAVRAELLAVLAEARAAQSFPWDARRTLCWRTVFPQMTNWLPDAEAAQLRCEFETEIRRLDAA